MRMKFFVKFTPESPVGDGGTIRKILSDCDEHRTANAGRRLSPTPQIPTIYLLNAALLQIANYFDSANNPSSLKLK